MLIASIIALANLSKALCSTSSSLECMSNKTVLVVLRVFFFAVLILP